MQLIAHTMSALIRKSKKFQENCALLYKLAHWSSRKSAARIATPGGGTLGISGWRCAALTLEPLA